MATQRTDDKLKELWERGQKVISGSRKRMILFVGVVLLLVLSLALIDTSPPPAHLDNRILAGSPEGHYHRVASSLSESASEHGGGLEVLTSKGSLDNLTRLMASADDCEVTFALVQDGLDWPDDERLKALGRLTDPEAVMFLRRRGAPPLTRFQQLRGATIGVGAEGSGTARVAQAIFESPPFAELQLQLVHHDLGEQLNRLASGSLDLGVFVINPSADLITETLRAGALELVSFDNTRALAATLPALSAGVISAGRYDPVAGLPRDDVNVLFLDTLIITNDCASRSEILGMMSLLSDAFPSFARVNQRANHETTPPVHPSAAKYLEDGEVGFVERTFPWLIDLLPLTNLVQIIMAVSILFNLMGGLHRFRLWRLDANRMGVEQIVHGLFDYGVSFDSIRDMEPQPSHLNPETLRELRQLFDRYQGLYERCRSQSISILVPMGQEMAYRYQEQLMLEALEGLGQYVKRVEDEVDPVEA